MGRYNMYDNRGLSLKTNEEIKIITDLCGPSLEEWNELNEWVKDKQESFYTNPFGLMNEKLETMNFIEARRFYLMMMEDYNNGK